jgi:hypothetical protein
MSRAADRRPSRRRPSRVAILLKFHEADAERLAGLPANLSR